MTFEWQDFPAIPVPTYWDRTIGGNLLREAAELGFRVEYVEFVESVLSPGPRGHALGVCILSPPLIRIREALKPVDRWVILAHELGHARNRDKPVAWHWEYDKFTQSRPEIAAWQRQVRQYLRGDMYARGSIDQLRLDASYAHAHQQRASAAGLLHH